MRHHHEDLHELFAIGHHIVTVHALQGLCFLEENPSLWEPEWLQFYSIISPSWSQVVDYFGHILMYFFLHEVSRVLLPSQPWTLYQISFKRTNRFSRIWKVCPMEDHERDQAQILLLLILSFFVQHLHKVSGLDLRVSILILPSQTISFWIYYVQPLFCVNASLGSLYSIHAVFHE